MDELLKHINARLETHGSCVVFENHLERVWPRAGKDRARRTAEIEDFAFANGLTVKISDPGIRVTFRKK